MNDGSQSTTTNIEGQGDGPHQLTQSQPSTTQSTPYATNRRPAGMYAAAGTICAILSLFVVPEIFGAMAIVLGAYTWKKEEGNRGLSIVILGIIFMIVGIYFTSLFELGDLVPVRARSCLREEEFRIAHIKHFRLGN